MKRKISDTDGPEPESAQNSSAETGPQFDNLGLDSRLLQAVSKVGWAKPTAIQSQAIPLALERKDIIARATTGSGKTAAYLLPIIDAILKRKDETFKPQATSALILVPTRELANQVAKAAKQLALFCGKDVRALNLSQKVSEAVQRSFLDEKPEIVVSTPQRASQSVNAGALNVDNLTHLVVDEADLVLSYNYEDDMKSIAGAVPKYIQKFFMSATLSADVEILKDLFVCRDLVTLNIEPTEDENQRVAQYVVQCGEDEKFLLAYVIFKLKLVKGKCIIFVSDIDRCYRLKLFFEQFGIKSCVLNSELPVNSRIHAVEEFNKNVYHIVIASDEHEIMGNEDTPKKEENSESQTRTPKSASDTQIASNISIEAEKAVKKAKLSSKKSKSKNKSKSKEYGISRGIDFQAVTFILNFDLPLTPLSYTHRIGRTARAGSSGTIFSFAVPSTLYRKHKSLSVATTIHDTTVLASIISDQTSQGRAITPYQFDEKQLEAFRYRQNDALRAVTTLKVREARTRELRGELIKSERLKRYWEENPGELRGLRHDGASKAVAVREHLKHVPEYLLPVGVNGNDAKNGSLGLAEGAFVPFKKEEKRKPRGGAGRMGKRGAVGRGRKGGSNPLKTFRVGK